MRVKRTLPPAAAPIALYDMLDGIKGQRRDQAENKDLKADIKNMF